MGSSRRSQRAITTPAIPDTPLNSTLSVSNWAPIRPREAPSAERTASSERRATPRASSIPATLAQAMSRTSPTAPINTRSLGV